MLVTIGWVLSIGCLIGTFLNCKKLKSCFIIWTFCNVGWLLYDLNQELFSRALLDFVQFILGIYGYIQWSKGDK